MKNEQHNGRAADRCTPVACCKRLYRHGVIHRGPVFFVRNHNGQIAQEAHGEGDVFGKEAGRVRCGVELRQFIFQVDDFHPAAGDFCLDIPDGMNLLLKIQVDAHAGGGNQGVDERKDKILRSGGGKPGEEPHARAGAFLALTELLQDFGHEALLRRVGQGKGMIRSAGEERFRLFCQHQAARAGTVGAEEGVGEELIRRQQADAPPSPGPQSRWRGSL